MTRQIQTHGMVLEQWKNREELMLAFSSRISSNNLGHLPQHIQVSFYLLWQGFRFQIKAKLSLSSLLSTINEEERNQKYEFQAMLTSMSGHTNWQWENKTWRSSIKSLLSMLNFHTYSSLTLLVPACSYSLGRDGKHGRKSERLSYYTVQNNKESKRAVSCLIKKD